MKKFFTLTFIAALALCAKAEEVTDVISLETVEITDTYTQVEYTGESGAVYLVTLKDEGEGPQFKAGNSGIVVTSSPGTVKSITVAWNAKSNEDMQVYGSTTAYTESNTALSGDDLGTIIYEKNTAVAFDIDGEWPYIALTSTVNNAKACKFDSLAITWNTTSGVKAIENSNDEVPVYYNLQGMQVLNPTSGVYIKRVGNVTTKVTLP